MSTGGARLEAELEQGLWPAVEAFLAAHETAGLAVAVVRDDETVIRGFGVRDIRTGAPVTPETMFHLASVSKPFVATAIVSLGPALDLDAPITRWVPELVLADGRADEVTARGLLSHTSGLPDVTDYGWHDPQLHDGALADFAAGLSGWRLRTDPGSAFAYSNAGYELLGLLLSRVTGTTFEEAVRREVLLPLGMERSTFLRADVPAELAASPHVGMPLQVPGEAYPYTRRHAPSSTLHSNLVEMCRWIRAHFPPGTPEAMWRPAIAVDRPPWEESMGLGWSLGTWRGHRVVSHSGLDPGFSARLAIAPDARTGVVVLGNSNTVPASGIALAGLDVALREGGPSLPGSLDPPADVDEDFVDAVWGAIELHRTGMVWPLLRRWTGLRPESCPAWTMTGWAHAVDGDVAQARTALERAVALDPDDEEAATLLAGLAPA